MIKFLTALEDTPLIGDNHMFPAEAGERQSKRATKCGVGTYSRWIP